MQQLTAHSYSEGEEAALYGGYALNKLLENHKNIPVLLLLSGGSALSLLDGVNMENVGELLSVAMLDERFSVDPAINNFHQFQQTQFFKEALDQGASFFGTLPRPKETAGELAARHEATLRQWREENQNGKIFATLGMGDDGHIAGIMPYPEDPKLFANLFQGEKWMANYNAGEKNQYPERITSTITFLKTFDSAIAYIAGRNKQKAFDRLRQKQNTLAELPAMIFWDIKNLEIYTDLK